MSRELGIRQFPIWDRMKARRAPISFTIEVTARCNNDCRHCYINLPACDATVRAAELTTHEILDIARQAVDMGAVWCLLTGGEPLLRDDFAELYLGLKRLGLLVSVFTNACLVTPEHVDLLKHFPPRHLEVSVYGVTCETYERVTRRPGSFDAFMRGLDLLAVGGVPMSLKAMALRGNVHELEAISAFCRERGAGSYRFDPLLHLRFDGDERRNTEIRSERLGPKEVVAIERADGERFGALQLGCDRLIRPDMDVGDHLFRCGAGDSSFSVGYDGTFRLCSSLWHPETTADLRSSTLLEAWAQVVPKVRHMCTDNPRFLERCGRCGIINLCMWCPAHAALETGELDEWVEYFCAVAHERAKALGADL